ncbi:MAG: hypothetical protein IJ568_04720 [Bacilli bacterium]|nr:hypothetical protein [Bacilli bacterium]
MINVDNKVRNIYYMLCYSFYGEQLNEKDEANLGDEAFDNIYNLFSLLLCLILKKEIKKGLHREYINTNEEIGTIRGKIDINETIKKNSLVKKKIICNFDEYSENCLLNQIIKTTMFYLVKSKKIGTETKNELKKLLYYFNNVDIIDTKTIKWDQVRFNRNNISYKFVLDLCKLILKGLIVSDRVGKNKFKEYLDDARVSAIYENFIKSYYRKHYPELKASSRRFCLSDKPIMNIPSVKTDITMEYEDRMLIIDAKFYNKIYHDHPFSKTKIISNDHLNQIYVYVDSQDPKKSGNVKGMLLYAQTIDEKPANIHFPMIGHDLYVKTLDMNDTWENIKNTLNSIAINFKNNVNIVNEE